VTLVSVVLAVIVGAVIPIQTGINSRLARHIGITLLASLVSFAVGTIGLGLVLLATRTPLPLAATVASQPWWIWIGGLCGLIFLTMNMVLLPRIGASATVILPLFGQVVGGLVIDMLGAFGTTPRPLTIGRVVGVVLVALGAVLVNLRIDPEFSARSILDALRADPVTAQMPVIVCARQAWLQPAHQTYLSGKRLRLLLVPFTPEELVLTLDRAISEAC